jgi:conjugative transfer signal peptidase TraF
MKRLLKRIALGVTATSLGGLLLTAVGYAAGARINTTRSIPAGLYWASSAPVGKGAYVMFCPPQAAVFADARERGYIGAGVCPGGYGYLMKRILAAKDDTVTVSEEGVRVNDELLPLSAPFRTDAAGSPDAALPGRPLPVGRGRTAADVRREWHLFRRALLWPDSRIADPDGDSPGRHLVGEGNAHADLASLSSRPLPKPLPTNPAGAAKSDGFIH